jgi:hypothetical protein
LKKKRVLEVSLDRAWVEEEVTADGVVRRDFHQERDERLKRVYEHPPESPPRSLLTLWCQEDHRGKRCNEVLAEVYVTSEGDLWEARIEGADPYDLEWRKMGPQSETAKKIPVGLHEQHQWLDDGADPLIARCPRHGAISVERAAVAGALSAGKKYLHFRGGRVIFG